MTTATVQYYEAFGVVYRWIRTSDSGNLLERWTASGWIDWPDLIAACGIGGDTSYEQITSEEADELMASAK